MSASSITYGIERDTIPFVRYKLWYQLSHEPIMDSFRITFDLTNNFTEHIPQPFVYGYSCIEQDCITKNPDYTVYNIVSTIELPHTNNGITYIPYTSQESVTFGKCLIGSHTIDDYGSRILITKENYLNYLYLLKGKTFIDLKNSNQIKVINEYDICKFIDVTYFYEV